MKYMNFGHTSLTVDILFKYSMSKYELFVFLWFLGVVLWALIIQGSKFLSKKLWQAHASASAANIKKIIVACPPGPNYQQMRSGFTNHRRQWHWPTRQCQRQQANLRRQWLLYEDLIHHNRSSVNHNRTQFITMRLDLLAYIRSSSWHTKSNNQAN
jgi:hypothetical protein